MVRSLLLLLLVLTAGVERAPGQGRNEPPRERGGTLLVRITDTIGWQQVALIQGALRQVESGSASLLVLELDTPGGRLDMTRKLVTLVQNLRRSKVETVAFVNSKAYSAGAIIALSTGRVFMREGSAIGDAYPIQMGPLGNPAELPAGILEKQLSVMRKEMEALAQAFPEGRRDAVALLAKAMVDPTLEVRQVQVRGADGTVETRILERREEELLLEKGFTVKPLKWIAPGGELLTLDEQQALEYGLADGIVSDRGEFFSLFNVSPEEVREVKLTAKEKFIDFLESISFFLLLGGLLFGLMALKIPGFGIPEVLALACFFLLFMAHWYTGLADWVELLLFLGGVALIALELFLIPGTFVAGILGGLMVLTGLVLSFQNFLLPETGMQWQMLETNFRYLVGTVLFLVVAGVLLSRLLPGIPFLGRVILDSPGAGGSQTSAAVGEALAQDRFRPGLRGEAVSALRPVGVARFGGEPIDVQTEGEFLEPGTPVEILRTDSNRVIVQRIRPVQGE